MNSQTVTFINVIRLFIASTGFVFQNSEATEIGVGIREAVGRGDMRVMGVREVFKLISCNN